MRSIRYFLKSSDFGVSLLIGSVIVQGFHSYFVFAALSNFDVIPKMISSIFYAFIFSCAILYYTMINKRNVALTFQIFESGINLYYFFGVIITMWIDGTIDWRQLAVRSIIAVGISIMMPYTIYQYAGSLSEVSPEEKKEDNIKLSDYMKNKIRKEAKKELLSQINDMDDIKRLNKKYLNDK